MVSLLGNVDKVLITLAEQIDLGEKHGDNYMIKC